MKKKSRPEPTDLWGQLSTYGTVQRLAPRQIRVANQIDFYTANNKFHVLRTGERGVYTTVADVMQHLQDKPRKVQIDPKEWKDIEGRPFVYIDLLDDRTKARKASVPQEYCDAKRQIYDAAMALPWPKRNR